MDQRKQIRRAYFIDGKSIRHLARERHHDRRTICKALRDAGPPRYTLEIPRRRPVLDPFTELIDRWLEQHRGVAGAEAIISSEVLPDALRGEALLHCLFNHYPVLLYGAHGAGGHLGRFWVSANTLASEVGLAGSRWARMTMKRARECRPLLKSYLLPGREDAYCVKQNCYRTVVIASKVLVTEPVGPLAFEAGRSASVQSCSRWPLSCLRIRTGFRP